MPKKTERGTLWDFSTSIPSENKKIEGGPLGNFFSKKSLTMPKKLKGGPFGIFQHPFRRKTKKLKGALWGIFFRKKVSHCRKN